VEAEPLNRPRPLDWVEGEPVIGKFVQPGARQMRVDPRPVSLQSVAGPARTPAPRVWSGMSSSTSRRRGHAADVIYTPAIPLANPRLDHPVLLLVAAKSCAGRAGQSCSIEPKARMRAVGTRRPTS
jgi:hypothetical protein